MNNNNDLALSRYDLRFVSPQAEADYNIWTIEDRLPAIRAAGWVAMFIWAFSPYSAYLLFADAFRAVLIPAYGIMVPAIAVALAASLLKSVRFLVMPVASIVLSLSGFVATWVGHTVTGEIGGASVGIMMAIMYAPFMRVTAGWSLAALAPPLGYCLLLVLRPSESVGVIGATEWFYCVFPITALLTVVFVNFMSDRRARIAYRNERIIERQKAALEQAQQQIRRYMPPAVAEQIITGNEAAIAEPKRQRVTVLFCDIVGFTDIADRVEPEVMTEVLNAYMSSMADLIEQHGGTLNEFAGDGLMALFGAPEALTPEDQVRGAISTAQAMQAKMPELNEQWRKLGLGAELKIRIGINTGVLSVGSFGSEGRMTYTAIGLQTNIAARIQSHCEPGGVLLSDASWHLVKDKIDCEPRGEVECKGLHFPVKVYAPRMKQ